MGRVAFLPRAARPTPILIMAEQLTEEQKAARLAGLRIERLGYVARGLTDRIEQVDAQIALLTGRAPAHQARAARRPRVDPGRETR